MVDVELTVDCILQLKVDELEAEWVKQAFHNEFMDLEPLALAVQEGLQGKAYCVRELRELQDALQPWLRGEKADTGEGLWTVLVENNVMVKNLMAMLCYIMDMGQKRLSNAVQKEACIAAASVYITLSATPGSVAFKAFHPMLFQKAIDTFKIWRHLEGTGEQRKKSSIRSSQGSQKGRKKQPRKSKQAVIEEDDEDENLFDEEDDGPLTPQEVIKINRALLNLLKNFVQCLQGFSLKQYDHLVCHSIQQLAELSKLEAETFNGIFNFDREVSQMRTVPELAYKGLQFLCASTHGEPKAMLTSVFKFLLPSLLMLFGDNNRGVAAQTIPRAIQDIQEQALNFVCCLVKKAGDQSNVPLRTLLQHMCSKVPDKTEYRRLVAHAVIKLMRVMTTQQYAKMIEWIHGYTRTSGMGYRVFALDLATLLLAEEEREQEPDMSEEAAMYLTHAFLVRMLIARSSDAAPTVRAKAMANFAQLCTSYNKWLIKEIVTPSAQQRPMRSRVFRTPGPAGRGSLPAFRLANDVTGQTERSQSSVQSVETMGPSVASASAATIETVPDATTSTRMSIPGGSTVQSSTNQTPAVTPSVGQSTRQLPDTPMRLLELTLGVDITMVDGRSVVSTLRRRAGDGKVNVRKAAIQALENIVRLDGECFDNQDLDVLEERCRDPALSVRKQSMLSLTALLQELPLETEIQQVWLSGVLPMVIDRETTVQERCLQIAEEIFLNNLAPRKRSIDQEHKMLWSMLQIIASPPGEEPRERSVIQAESVFTPLETRNSLAVIADAGTQRKYLQKACQLWSRAKKLKPSHITSLQSHIGTENDMTAWMFLSLLVPMAPKFNPDFVLEYWQTRAMFAPEAEYRTVEWVLSVMGHITGHLQKEDLSTLAGHLKKRLMKFDSPPELISATVGTLNKVCHTLSDDATQARKVTDQWFGELLKACDSYLSAAILCEDQEKSLDEEECIRHLFTLGEITQLCPTKTPRRVFTLVQSIIAAPVITADDPPASQTEPESSQPSSQTSPEAADKDVTPPESSQPSTDGFGSQPQTQVLSQFKGSKMSSRLRAHAFIALGKLCLQNEDLAKKCVPAMARELETSSDLAVRNNVVIILSDLCIRYTTLVDRYVSNISACLKDKSSLIRIQTLTLLTRLVQEDFLKWKGTLFYRVLSTLTDDNLEVKNFAQFWLVHLLVRRHPGIFFHHFIECVFYFNSYDNHKVFNKVSETEREKKLFSLKGKANASKRMQLYRFLLEHMTDEHKFNLTAKLSKEILGAVVDGLIPLDQDSSALLQDALCILASKEIKLSSMRAVTHDDPMDEMERAALVMDAAKKTLITQVFKKNVIENIVPTVISLKHMLESHHSPVLKELMLFLRELMKDYKNEVKDILAADRQVASEIEFDMRKFEEEEQEEQDRRRAGRSTAAQLRTPTEGNLPKSPTGMRPPTGTATPQAAPPVPGSMPSAQRSPALRRHPGTPLARLVGTPQGGRAGTPLSTLAIMNSARKAMEKAKKLGQPGNSQPKASTLTAARPAVISPEAADITPETGNQGFKTPKARHHSRAISTPSVNLTLGNITFQQGEHNLSMIPSSPIPSSLPGRVCSNQGEEEPASPSWTCRQEVDENGQRQQRDVIHMFSPDKPTPKVRQWKLRTPITENPQNQQDKDSGEKDGGGDAPRADESAETRKRLRSDSAEDEPAAQPQGRRTRSKQRHTSEQDGDGAMPPRHSSRSQKVAAAAAAAATDEEREDSSVARPRRRARRKT